jgi:peptidoglycan/LPS O-acetylase OafA/YrhL
MDRSALLSPQRPRLSFLDIIRGLAALYVLVHHACAEVQAASLAPWARLAVAPFRFGNLGVAVFIVLSGYCLMLPAARDGSSIVRGGMREYLRRRSRRILPPYFAMLGLSLVLITVVTRLPLPHNPRFEEALPALRPDVIASHLLLVHNLRPQWIFKIDPPMWSVAVEWQIYFVFPILLVLRRRAGMAAVIVLAFTVGYAHVIVSAALHATGLVQTNAGATALRAAEAYGRWGAPFLALFAIGMAGAVVAHAPGSWAEQRRRTLPWAGLAAMGTLLTAVLCANRPGDDPLVEILPIAGVTTLALLVACACRKASAQRSSALARAGLFLGMISYSLYLVHYPLLSVTHMALMALGLSATLRLVTLLALAVPASIAVAYAFHIAFERPFLAGAEGSRTLRRQNPAQKSSVSGASLVLTQ